MENCVIIFCHRLFALLMSRYAYFINVFLYNYNKKYHREREFIRAFVEILIFIEYYFQVTNLVKQLMSKANNLWQIYFHAFPMALLPLPLINIFLISPAWKNTGTPFIPNRAMKSG
jgi:hypothetical protein